MAPSTQTIAVIGFDINAGQIDAPRAGHDATLEVSKGELSIADELTFTSDPADLATASIYIVTVPTPIDADKSPDLIPLLKTSEMLGIRVVVVVAELRDYGVHLDVHDPWVDAAEAEQEYGIALTSTPEPASYDGVVLAVAHDSYREAGASALRGYGRPGHVFCDLKSVFTRDESDLRL